MKIDLHFLPTLSNINTIFVRITPCVSLKCSKVTGLRKIEKNSWQSNLAWWLRELCLFCSCHRRESGRTVRADVKCGTLWCRSQCNKVLVWYVCVCVCVCVCVSTKTDWRLPQWWPRIVLSSGAWRHVILLDYGRFRETWCSCIKLYCGGSFSFCGAAAQIRLLWRSYQFIAETAACIK